jgi:hypothetical protein
MMSNIAGNAANALAATMKIAGGTIFIFVMDGCVSKHAISSVGFVHQERMFQPAIQHESQASNADATAMIRCLSSLIKKAASGLIACSLSLSRRSEFGERLVRRADGTVSLP